MIMELARPGTKIALPLGAPESSLSSGTYTHRSWRIRPRAFQHYMAGGQITVHPDRGISDIPRHGKSCTNAGGLRPPVSRPVPVVYRAIAPASENCMRSYPPLKYALCIERDLLLICSPHGSLSVILLRACCPFPRCCNSIVFRFEDQSAKVLKLL
jgi:hypothetical protein